MIGLCEHEDDPRIIEILSTFPNYVSSRYGLSDTEMTRLEMVNLAIDAQFIAASAMRRISGVALKNIFISNNN